MLGVQPSSAIWPYLRNYLFTKTPRGSEVSLRSPFKKNPEACNRGKYFQLATTAGCTKKQALFYCCNIV